MSKKDHQNLLDTLRDQIVYLHNTDIIYDHIKYDFHTLFTNKNFQELVQKNIGRFKVNYTLFKGDIYSSIPSNQTVPTFLDKIRQYFENFDKERFLETIIKPIYTKIYPNAIKRALISIFYKEDQNMIDYINNLQFEVTLSDLDLFIIGNMITRLPMMDDDTIVKANLYVSKTNIGRTGIAMININPKLHRNIPFFVKITDAKNIAQSSYILANIYRRNLASCYAAPLSLTSRVTKTILFKSKMLHCENTSYMYYVIDMDHIRNIFNHKITKDSVFSKKGNDIIISRYGLFTRYFNDSSIIDDIRRVILANLIVLSNKINPPVNRRKNFITKNKPEPIGNEENLFYIEVWLNQKKYFDKKMVQYVKDNEFNSIEMTINFDIFGALFSCMMNGAPKEQVFELLRNILLESNKCLSFKEHSFINSYNTNNSKVDYINMAVILRRGYGYYTSSLRIKKNLCKVMYDTLHQYIGYLYDNNLHNIFPKGPSLVHMKNSTKVTLSNFLTELKFYYDENVSIHIGDIRSLRLEE